MLYRLRQASEGEIHQVFNPQQNDLQGIQIGYIRLSDSLPD